MVIFDKYTLFRIILNKDFEKILTINASDFIDPLMLKNSRGVFPIIRIIQKKMPDQFMTPKQLFAKKLKNEIN